MIWIETYPNVIRRYLMDNWTFGVTMIVVGMGGTLLTLWILSLLMSVLKKVFPLKKEGEGKKARYKDSGSKDQAESGNDFAKDKLAKKRKAIRFC